MKAELFSYSLPLRQPLNLRGQTLAERTGLLLKLTDEDGSVGWGDAAPLPGFSRETMDQCIDSFSSFAESIRHQAYFDVFQERAHLFSDWNEEPPSVSFAIESALWAMLQQGDEFNAASDEIQLSALLSGDRDTILEKAGALGARPITCVKVKVGRGRIQEEAGLVREVSALLGAGCALRLDANRAWTLEDAETFVKALQGTPLEYIEEPLQNPEELQPFLDKTRVPYALDETLYEMPPPGNAKDVMDTMLGEHRSLWFKAAAWVWKPTLLHVPMLGPALKGLARGESCPKLVVSAAFESGVGIASLAQYAAAYMDAPVAAGLDTYAWLAEDVLLAALPLSGGYAEAPAVGSLARQIDISRLRPISLLC